MSIKNRHSFNRVDRRGVDARRGTAIVPALVTVVIVATLSMIFLQLSLAKNKEQRSSVDAKRAFYLAEAGLSEGFNGLALGKSGNVGTPDLPAEFGNGLFWTTATEIGGGYVRLQSTGLCGAGRATLSEVVERQADTVCSLGFYGDNGITVEAGAMIDSYDSRNGTYASQAFAFPVGGLLPTGARVGCNSDITVRATISPPTVILGDVRPGPLGTLFRDASALISGSMAPSTSTITLPEVKVPVVPTTASLTLTDKGRPTNLQRGVHGFQAIHIMPGTTLQITGPAVLVTRVLESTGGGNLVLDASAGPIRLYVLDSMSFASGTKLTTVSTDPAGVNLQVASTDVNSASLRATGTYYGSIYAPHAQLTIPAGLDVFGAATAKTLTIKAGGKLHFDRALASSSDESSGAPRLLGWHIVELPNVPAVKLRFDALSELRRLGIIPPKAKNAHFDIGVTPP